LFFIDSLLLLYFLMDYSPDTAGFAGETTVELTLKILPETAEVSKPTVGYCFGVLLHAVNM
jgi:hypothetical protein